jgi:N-acetylglutamate synthase-like GNAT family acetyltransferase
MNKFKGIIRELRAEDVNQVEKIFDLYWKDAFRERLADKLTKYFQHDSELVDQKMKFFVAEENGEIVGVAGIRRSPGHMQKYVTTGNPGELYVIAVRGRGGGIGEALKSHCLAEAGKEGYTEVVLFSGESHRDAWKFHDKHFKRLGTAVSPTGGEGGYVWGKII